ncbi:hypothetical protein CRYUN_Cryun28dG0080600 [Craigia yunnanensis]
MEAAAASEDCFVKVAVHVRPLIGDEKLEGCKNCVTVSPGKPQVQIGTHSFTFDHVYGSTGSPTSSMFEECIVPLVDGLFQGYNATVLAYGQTGSGKTYTMGTGFEDGCQTGIVPQILKEEVQDLLDPTSLNKSDIASMNMGKVNVPGKPPIQIRESSNGVITLAGSTGVSVSTLKEMAACLGQGSLSRATGSTNMNNQSSRSHAIFTISLEQMRKLNPISGDVSPNDIMNEEYLCAKLHLVDLAGSERAKRTGSDGMRFKEGFTWWQQQNCHDSIESSDYQMGETVRGDSGEIDEEAAKEWEHTLLQNTMDEELHELDRLLEEKEQERDRLLAEIENLSAGSDGQTQKVQDIHAQKLKSLEAQILDLKKKQENQVQLLKQKQKSDEAAKQLQDEIQFIKAQKVQLQHRIKQKAEQFRQWKASREKELLQLRKEGRRNEYERHKLQALNQRQKMVLQRKTEEAAMATKRLKELLEARKSSAHDNSAVANGNGTNGQINEKALQHWLDHELEVMVNVHEVRFEYEKQSQVRAALAEELAVLKQVDEFASKGLSPPRGKNGFARASSMSPNARVARISSLENMLSISSNSLVAMASQLSEAEERERAFTNRGRWNQLRSMGDTKNLLQYMFNSLGDTRCQLWEKDLEIKEMKEQLRELVGLLRQSELQRKEVENELKLREQAVAFALAKSATDQLVVATAVIRHLVVATVVICFLACKQIVCINIIATPSLLFDKSVHGQGNSPNSLKYVADDMNGSLSPMSVLAQKQLKFSPGIVNGPAKESAAFINQTRKLPMKKLIAIGQAGNGKLWRWKRSHHQWLVQFKWKWQKPWRLSEWIRHSDETIIRARPRSRALPHRV